MPSLLDDPFLASFPVVAGHKVVGGVVIYQKLGKGGMGALYRGLHLRLEIDVAVKVMVPPEGVSPAVGAKSVQRFLREARTAAAIDHQNLVRVLDVNSQEGAHYLVMHYIDGESALERQRRKGELTEAEAVMICLGTAQGLAAAHRNQVVHRDVKPDNIMIDRLGRVKVTDLGLAKSVRDPEPSESTGELSLTVSRQAVGTPYYMAPEQTRSARRVGPPADVWSLGVTFYRLLTGEFPWSNNDLSDLIQQIRTASPTDVRQFRPDTSEGARRIINRALQKDPGRRYPDCGALADDFRRVLTRRPHDWKMLADEAAGSLRRTCPARPPTRGQLGSIAAYLHAVESRRTGGVAAHPTNPALSGPRRGEAHEPSSSSALDLPELRRTVVPPQAYGRRSRIGLLLVPLVLFLGFGLWRLHRDHSRLMAFDAVRGAATRYAAEGRFNDAFVEYRAFAHAYDGTSEAERALELAAELSRQRRRRSFSRMQQDVLAALSDGDLNGALRRAESFAAHDATAAEMAEPLLNRLRHLTEEEGTRRRLERARVLAEAGHYQDAARELERLNEEGVLTEEVGTMRERYLTQAYQAVLEQTQADVSAGRMDAAVADLDMHLRQAPNGLRKRIAALRDELIGAQQQWQQTLEQVAHHQDAGRLGAALQALDAFAETTQVQSMRRRARQYREALARKMRRRAGDEMEEVREHVARLLKEQKHDRAQEMLEAYRSRYGEMADAEALQALEARIEREQSILRPLDSQGS